MDTERAKTIHCIMAVWGESYTRLFLDVSLPSQLAPGNIPAIAGVYDVVYYVYTTEADAVTIRRHPAYARLAGLVRVEIICDDDSITTDKFAPLITFHNRSILHAAKSRAALLFLAPDFVLADGGLQHLAELHAGGKRAIFTLTPRMLREQSLPALLAGFNEETQSIDLPPQVLAGLALQHLHPIEQSYFWGESFSSFPIHAYWRSGGEAIIAHCFYLHPIFVDPEISTVTPVITIDADYVDRCIQSRSAVHVVQDSDEFLCVELSSARMGDANATQPPWAATVWQYANWARTHTNPVYESALHHWLFEQQVCLHTCGRANLDRKTMAEAQGIARRVVRLIHLGRALRRVKKTAAKVLLVDWAREINQLISQQDGRMPSHTLNELQAKSRMPFVNTTLRTIRALISYTARRLVPRGLLHFIERLFQISVMSEKSSPEKWRSALEFHMGVAPQLGEAADSRRALMAAALQAVLQKAGYVVVERAAKNAEDLLAAELEQSGALVLRKAQVDLLTDSGQRAATEGADPSLLRFALHALPAAVERERTLSGQWRERLRELPEQIGARFMDTTVDAVLGSTHRSLFWGDRMLTLDKACSFRNDAAFMRAWRSVHATHAYDQYVSPDGISWRMYVLCWAARRGLALEGDFVECGVFKGDMSLVVVQSTGFPASGKTFYLYDTFSGFAAKYSSPADFPMNEGFFDYANRIYSEAGIYESVVERFAPYETVKVVRGVLPDSLDQACPEKIAYLHIDLNSPQAEIGTLLRLFDRVSPGGAVIFDDYGWIEYERQREVEDAFMAERGYTILELPTGQGLVVK